MKDNGFMKILYSIFDNGNNPNIEHKIEEVLYKDITFDPERTWQQSLADQFFKPKEFSFPNNKEGVAKAKICRSALIDIGIKAWMLKPKISNPNITVFCYDSQNKLRPDIIESLIEDWENKNKNTNCEKTEQEIQKYATNMHTARQNLKPQEFTAPIQPPVLKER